MKIKGPHAREVDNVVVNMHIKDNKHAVAGEILSYYSQSATLNTLLNVIDRIPHKVCSFTM